MKLGVFLTTSILAIHLLAEEPAPTPLAKELREAMRDNFEPTLLRNTLAIFYRAKAEDMDGLLWAFDDCAKDGIKRDMQWSLYIQRRAELEGVKLLDRLSDGDLKVRGVGSYNAAMEGCITRAPDEATAWLRAHAAHPQFRPLYISAVGALARKDAAEAGKLLFEFAEQVPEKDLNDACGVLCDQLRILRGNAAIVERFATLTAAQKKVAWNHAGNRIKEGDIALAAKWFKEQAGKEWSANDSHLWSLMTRYAAAKPEEAMEWCITLPPPPGKTYPGGIGAGMERWAMMDPIASGKWLQKYGDESWWPRAAGGYYRGLKRKDPESARKFLEVLPVDFREKVQTAVDNW